MGQTKLLKGLQDSCNDGRWGRAAVINKSVVMRTRRAEVGVEFEFEVEAKGRRRGNLKGEEEETKRAPACLPG